MASKAQQHVVLDLEMIADLKRLSAARNESMSVLVREALRPYLAKNKVVS